MRLPRRLTVWPEDERFAAMPAVWHLSGILIPAGWRNRRPFRRWWSWWVDQWLAAIRAASERERQTGEPWGDR